MFQMNDKDQGSDPPLGEESPWEKAWTLDEMQKGASHWSLAGDAGVRNTSSDAICKTR